MEHAEGSATATLGLERGAVLGDRLRRHWVPVLPVGLLERQHSRRVKVLGEDLVCYRDLAGTIGLIGDRCPHRFVSLEWGVAAEEGLRCPYHGWCFDETGQCIDIPIGGVDMFKDVALAGYPVTEVGGVLFAFLGDREAPPRPEPAEVLACQGAAEISYCVVEAPFERTFSTIADLSIPRSTLNILEEDATDGALVEPDVAHWETDATIENDAAELRGERRYRHASLTQLVVSTAVTFRAPFYSVIETGNRRIVRIRVPLDDLHTVVMNHVSFAGDTAVQSLPRAFDVGALDHYGAPLDHYGAPSVGDSVGPDDEVGDSFVSAQLASLRDFMSGVDDRNDEAIRLRSPEVELRDRDLPENVREILEYTGFPTFQIARQRVRSTRAPSQWRI